MANIIFIILFSFALISVLNCYYLFSDLEDVDENENDNSYSPKIYHLNYKIGKHERRDHLIGNSSDTKYRSLATNFQVDLLYECRTSRCNVTFVEIDAFQV